MAALIETPIAEAKATFDVNVWGLLAVTQAFIPLLIACKGTILNIGSGSSKVPVPMQGIYNASKGVVEDFSRVLRIELEAFDVTVVQVSPLST